MSCVSAKNQRRRKGRRFPLSFPLPSLIHFALPCLSRAPFPAFKAFRPLRSDPPAAFTSFASVSQPEPPPPPPRALLAVGARLGGSRILHTLLAYAGTKSETHADLLVPALCSSVGDDDADIAGRVVACVHVLGATTSPSVWLPLALDGLGRAGQQTAAQVASALVVLAGLLHAACVARKSYAVPATMIEVQPPLRSPPPTCLDIYSFPPPNSPAPPFRQPALFLIPCLGQSRKEAGVSAHPSASPCAKGYPSRPPFTPLYCVGAAGSGSGPGSNRRPQP